jgi:hypothetical protein
VTTESEKKKKEKKKPLQYTPSRKETLAAKKTAQPIKKHKILNP